MSRGGDTLLLDTHVWYWLANGEHGAGSAAAWAAVEDAGERNAVGVSEISLWEIALKSRKKQFRLDPTPREWLRDASKMPGIGIMEVDRKVLVDSALLDMKHRDPADRILIATALRYNMRLATADQAIIEYAAQNSKFQVLDMTS